MLFLGERDAAERTTLLNRAMPRHSSPSGTMYYLYRANPFPLLYLAALRSPKRDEQRASFFLFGGNNAVIQARVGFAFPMISLIY